MKGVKQFGQSTGSYIRLLLAADPKSQDIALLVFGVITAIASGIPFPILGIIFGQLVDDVNSASCSADSQTVVSTSFQASVNNKVLTVVWIGIGNLLLIYVYIVSWNLFGERLAQRVREKYLRSLLHEDVSFFDNLSPGAVSSHLNTDITTIQQGTSEKVGIVINALSFFVTAYIIAFIKHAKLAGMLVSLTPAFMIMPLGGGYFIGRYAMAMSTKIASASSMALEGMSNIMVVHAFGANTRLEKRFHDIVSAAKRDGLRKAFAVSIQSGLLYFIAYSANALAYWQGSESIAASVAAGNTNTTVGSIYTVIFILVDATIILSTVAPFLHVFGAAQAAFKKLNSTMKSHRPSRGKQNLDKPEELLADDISLQDVSFSYPSRSDDLALDKVSFKVSKDKHTALVGPSGSGKSTITHLLLRLYDPSGGKICVGNNDLQSFIADQWRGNISLVQQEPALFNRTIFENVAHGLIGSSKHSHLHKLLLSGSLHELSKQCRMYIEGTKSTQKLDEHAIELIDLVVNAAQIADAHDFICRLKYGYATVVGAKGALISGGQKQRISIARALVKDPQILILDEAMAALDSTSERRIHIALHRASKGRTTISVAHRLSSIEHADHIIVMKAGTIAEQGSHNELIARGGVYAELVHSQTDNQSESFPDGCGSDSSNGESISINEKQEENHSTVPNTNKLGRTQTENTEPSGTENTHDPDLDETRPASFVLGKVLRYLRPSLLILIIAFISITIVGGTYSAAAAIFGNTIQALSSCQPAERIRSGGRFFALMFFVLAIIELFANIISWTGFGFAAERVLQRFRIASFKALLEQDLQWHEDQGRTPSSLLSILSSDVASIGGLTGSTIGTIFSVLVNLIAAIVLTHILAWKIALVCLAVVPLLLGAGTMQLIVLARFAARHKEAFTQSVGIAVESVEMIRTVKAFGLQEDIMCTYRRSLDEPIREVTRRSLYANLWLALAYGLPNFVYALAYWWGTKLVLRGEYSQTQFFIVLVALLVSAQLWGQLFTLAPDVTKAFAATRRVVNLINLSPNEPQGQQQHISEKGSTSTGLSVIFDKVNFSYPARPDVQVLHNLTFSISPGQFAALVGPSGAGKSTIIALLERMYRPSSGNISISGTPTASSPSSFRDSIAFVPQDNVLFEGTLRFNIALGAAPHHDPTNEEIEEACRLANIHETIAALPERYDTQVGTAGNQFSGGQRQRLAIARALVRRPRLLLLDESTSALDAESERMFQRGLEEVRRRGTTVIAIAHRLTTIRRADVILYLEGGRVVESGTHEELMERCAGYRVNAKLQGF